MTGKSSGIKWDGRRCRNEISTPSSNKCGEWQLWAGTVGADTEETQGSWVLWDRLSSWRDEPLRLQPHRPSSFTCSNSSGAVVLQDLRTYPSAAWSSFSRIPFAATLPCFIFAAHIIIRSYLLYLLCVYGPSPLAQGPCQSCSPRCPGAQDSAWYTVNTRQRWR